MHLMKYEEFLRISHQYFPALMPLLTAAAIASHFVADFL